MPNVFDVLQKDHEEVKKALAELEKGPTATTGAGSDQLKVREKLVDQLIIEESKHEAVEEEYFWPAVRDKLSDGDHLADEATDQEQAAKHILNDLMDLSPDDPRFEDRLRTFITDGREHIAYEEERVWPRMREALSAEEADELGTKVEEGKKLAPTRPHPNTPPRPGILKTVGKAAAVADRARDAVTGRGD
ncbi:hemerythrin domain-containing protein [Actinoallomurus sp. NPDC052274]|uniref:hemerythrin domain-containing protein n=1 Tax=Actinoallomurus sp. NPDC052274 TaxID=3155420 RepID=UPI0034415420